MKKKMCVPILLALVLSSTVASPNLDMSFGLGGMYTPIWVSSNNENPFTVSGGFFGFFDATYVTVKFGMTFALTDFSNGRGTLYEEKYGYDGQFFDAGIFFKYPFVINRQFEIFPLVGITSHTFLSGSSTHNGEHTKKRRSGSYDDYFDYAEVSLGVGLNYNITKKLYLRTDALVGFPLFTSEWLNQNQSNVAFKLSLGYKVATVQNRTGFVESSTSGDKNSSASKTNRPDWTTKKSYEENGKNYFVMVSNPLVDLATKNNGWTLTQAQQDTQEQVYRHIAQLIGVKAKAEGGGTKEISKSGDETIQKQKVYTEIFFKSASAFSGLSISDSYYERYERKVKINGKREKKSYIVLWSRYVISTSEIVASTDAIKRMDSIEKMEIAAYTEAVQRYAGLYENLKNYNFEQEPVKFQVAYSNINEIHARLMGLSTFRNPESEISNAMRQEYSKKVAEINTVLRQFDPSDRQKVTYESQIYWLTRNIAELEIQNKDLELQLSYKDGQIAGLTNQARQQRVSEMARMDTFSEALLASMSQALTPAAMRNADRYVVKRGDYLAKIAQEYYGNSAYFMLIFAANRDRINSNNPNVLRSGITLLIPKLSPDLEAEKLLTSLVQ